MDGNPNVDPERDPESGRFTEKYPDNSIIKAIESLGGEATTQEIADEVGCPYHTAYSRLRALADDGPVHSRRVSNAHLWGLHK